MSGFVVLCLPLPRVTSLGLSLASRHHRTRDRSDMAGSSRPASSGPGVSGWRELANGVGEVEAGDRCDRDDGSVQAGRLVLGHALAALFRGSVDH